MIIGNGPAGLSAAKTLRRIAPMDQVAVVTGEGQPCYSKVLTSYYVGGKVPYDNMILSGCEGFCRDDYELLLGKKAVRVDPSAREVTLSGGERIQYDRLLIATGAEPFVPPIEGMDLPGVFTLWTHDDSIKLKDWVRDGQKAVVIGAGLVGLKAAEALVTRGVSVTVVELLDRVLPLVLAQEDAAIVQKAIEKNGVVVKTRTGLVRIFGDDRVRQVELSDGTVMDCDVVVVATGVKANLTLAKSAGIAFGRGILVNEFLETNVPGIFAAGDVAEGWDAARGKRYPNPTWGNASEQGRLAAYNMAGFRKPFQGAVTLNTFTFLGFSMAAVGITQPDGDYLLVKTYCNPKSGDYRKLVMLSDRLVGGVAIGDVKMAGIWRWLIARRSPIASFADALLLGKADFAAAHGFA